MSSQPRTFSTKILRLTLTPFRKQGAKGINSSFLCSLIGHVVRICWNQLQTIGRNLLLLSHG